MYDKLSFSDFVDYVRDHIRTGWWEDRKLEIRRIKKNNGVELTALLFPREDTSITPSFYLERFYEDYLERGPGNPSFLFPGIRARYEQAEDSLDTIDVEKLNDYETMRDSVVFRLVNYEKNAEVLEDCPHVRRHDLALTFRSLVNYDETAVSTALITNEQMEDWGVSLADLMEDAARNTRKLFPPRIYDLNRLLDHSEEPEDMTGVYVATNRQMLYGAVVLFYQDVLEEFARKTGAGFYVMPSSVHEVLLVPDMEDYDPEILCCMVREVNETIVSEDEILSDSVYYYDPEEGKLARCHVPAMEKA
ncbi:MAG: hypothetical protein IKX76_04350 [Eubacterium sp.]|nr:hypothetical protein [Eubacterium sp.]